MKNMKNKQLIIEKITGLSKEQLFLNSNISNKHNNAIEEALIRLKNGEPIEYILESASFYGLDFYVDRRVLIPRNDTEVMVDKVIKEINHPPHSSGTSLIFKGRLSMYSLIDIGTGSSCIAISTLKNRDNISSCYVVDISEEALEVSKINIEKHKLESKIISIKGDLLEPFLKTPPLTPPLTGEGNNRYALHKNIVITANLPYIKDKDYKNMDNSVIKYEPKLALYGGKGTGFELYQKLINQCLELKKIYNITLFIEIGFDQKKIAESFLNSMGLKYEIFKDNGLVDRCIKISFE